MAEDPTPNGQSQIDMQAGQGTSGGNGKVHRWLLYLGGILTSDCFFPLPSALRPLPSVIRVGALTLNRQSCQLFLKPSLTIPTLEPDLWNFIGHMTRHQPITFDRETTSVY